MVGNLAVTAGGGEANPRAALDRRFVLQPRIWEIYKRITIFHKGNFVNCRNCFS